MKRLLPALLLAVLASRAWAIKVESIDTRAYPRLRGLAAVPGGRIEVVSGQALARFAGGTAAAQREAALASMGASIVKELPSVGWTLVALPDGMRVADGMGLLSGLPAVEAVEPNNVYRPNRVPNDPLVSAQWALSQINASAAWEYEVGTSCRATIAVIDTGVDAAHPDLSGKMGAPIQHRFCDPTAAPDKCVNEAPVVACDHGTRVAGIAAAEADNSQAIAGLSWGAQILALRVFRVTDCNSDCSDKNYPAQVCATDDTGMIEALDYAVSLQNTQNYGKIIVNMSLGNVLDKTCHGPVASALAAAVTSGIPVAIAAGNDYSGVNAPATCAAHASVIAAGGGVIPVGATDSSNAVASFSSRGQELASCGVVAPGVSVLSTDINNGTAADSGTSFSAPHVAGLAALILSAKPALSAAKVQEYIRGGADQIGVSASISGAGRVNALRSLRLAVRGTLADFDGDQKAIAFPNPLRTSRTGAVSFAIPTSLQGQNAKIKVYTASGELVRELAGLTWDAKNAAGKLVASGTYIFVVSTDKGTTRGRVAVIR